MDAMPEPAKPRTDARASICRWPQWASWLAALACYSGLAIVAYWHVWGAPGARVVAPESSDPARMIWFLAWFPYALGHGHNPLLAGWANAPYGVNVLVNTSQPLLGLLAAP